MKKVGITGNMGSGKSTVCMLFKTLGIPVYDSDSRAKELMNTHVLKARIIDLLGDRAYSSDGSLDRSYIAEQVFSDPSKLHQLNAIVHPAVRNDVLTWQQENVDRSYGLIESALIFENNKQHDYDKIIVVSAPREVRKTRVKIRNQWTDEEIENRMKQQLDESDLLKKADFIIQNDGKHALIKQVLAIHRHLIAD